MIIYSDKKLREVKYFKVNAFNDFRGQIWTFWEKKYFKNIKFNLDKFTLSKKNVLRGFHGDRKSWRLITCVKGEVLNVIVDFRPNSKNYLKFSSFRLNDKNKASFDKQSQEFKNIGGMSTEVLFLSSNLNEENFK